VDTVHECDGQTDGQTNGQTDRITITKTMQRIALHGKKANEGCNSCARARVLLMVMT